MSGKFSNPENSISIRYSASGRRSYKENICTDRISLPFEMIFALKKGAAKITFGEKTVLCKKGEVLLIPCDSEYTIFPTEPTEAVYVLFEAKIFTSLRLLSFFGTPSFFGGAVAEMIISLCENIADIGAENEFTNARLENAVKTLSFLYTIVSEITENSVPLKDFDKTERDFSAFAKVFSYIGEHISENIMQETLAEISGLSIDSFYREFKAATFDAPKDYIISEKLRYAKSLLVEGKLTVGEISKKIGYENQFYFSNLFHKRYGISPTEYKRKVSSII